MQVTTDYLSLEELKKSLFIRSRTNDEKLLDILQDARQEVDSVIKPYVDKVPLKPEPDSNTYVYASKCALHYARARWYEFQSQMERAKYQDEQYEKKLEILKKSIRADKPGRTKAVFVQDKDPLRDRTYLTHEIDLYFAREFEG